MKKRVLLVEYAMASIDIIKEILPSKIFDINIVNEGESAKELLKKQSFDLMITAAMLPKFHGFELSQFAAENFPNMIIIIISEIYKGRNYKHQAINIFRAHDFFEKPLNQKEFKERIFELLNISEENFEDLSHKSTTNMFPIETKKIPSFEKLDEEKKKLTSEDLFGDIIDEVHDKPIQEKTVKDIPFNEKLLAKKKKENQPSNKQAIPPIDKAESKTEVIPQVIKKSIPIQKAPVTQKIVPPVTQLINTKTQEVKTRSKDKTQKINKELLDLLQTGKKDISKNTNDHQRKFKKIEDDISKKLEDTLSGLGVGGKTYSPPKKKPVKPEMDLRTQLLSSVPQKKTKIKRDELERTDEMEVGGYEILGLIGRGGMAEIYKAKKRGIKGFEKVIALKKILSGYGEDAKFIEMFVDEAKIAAELSHPNIVEIYDLGKKDDYYFIAMEYVSGKDLRVILQKLGKLGKTMPEEIAIHLIIKVLDALKYAHTARDSKGIKLEIVHRDISPPNILVSYNGNIKLTDFGVSKASNKMHQTLAGALKGKLLYMSPEQAKGDDNIDSRSDLYSVGIILFELLMGKKLFLDSSEIGTLKKVQEGKVIRPSLIKKDIEPELETIIMKALNKNMNKRYQYAENMIRDLEVYLAKHYNSFPEPSHISYFIYNLFKDEIIKENIEINLVSPPLKITKKKKQEPKKEAKLPAVPELPEVEQFEELPEPPQPKKPAIKIPPNIESEKAIEKEENLKTEEEFQPIIEISLDEEKPSKPKPEQKVENIETPQPVLESTNAQVADFGSVPLRMEKKSHLKLYIILGIVVSVCAIAIFIFLNMSTGDNNKGDDSSAPPLNLTEQSTQTSNITEGKTDTPDPIGTTSSEAFSFKTDIKEQTDQNNLTKEDTSTDDLIDKKKKTSPELTSLEKKEKSSKMKLPVEKTERTKDKKVESSRSADSKVMQKEQKGVEETEKIKSKEVKTGIIKSQSKKSTTTQSQKNEQSSNETPDTKKIESPSLEKKDSASKVEQKPTTTQSPKEIMTSPKSKEVEIKEGDVLSPSQVDTQPIAISTPPIRISRNILRLLTADQRVLVSYLVDHKGNVESIKLLNKTPLKKLNNSIINAIKKWKYKPATKDNKKVKMWKNKWISIPKN